MSTMPKKVLIFDSGLGGISIFRAIQKLYPYCELIYCTDNEAFPYGNKPEHELVERVSKVLLLLDQTYMPDIFVIACNTASTVALPKVRSLIKSPVVGVVPAIKPAVAITKTPYIGLLATPGTVNRPYTQSLIDQFSGSLKWIRIGSSELVELAEKKMYGGEISTQAIEKIVTPFAQYSTSELDTIVLACTHFPLIKQEIQQVLPRIRHWVDSSDAVANRVGFWLHELGIREGDDQIPCKNHQIIFTRKLADETGIAYLLKDLDIKKTNTLGV
jgi:glutamate racemase